MAILERIIQRVVDDKWAEIVEHEKQWDALEAKIGGFPKKRCYRAFAGPYGIDTIIFEREWESLVAYEAAAGKYESAPEYAALQVASNKLKVDMRIELYIVII